ncbi:MAG: RNA polymerase sigma factor [Myxococcota bacterium]
MTSQPAPLDELMRRLAQGDRSVFAAVFEQLWGPTKKLCVRMMGDEASGEDAAQAAMIRISERALDYDPARPALPWALAIASWECRTLLRKRTRARETTELPPSVSDGGASAEAQEQQQLVSAALNALGTLSPADQETLVATYWDTAASASGATLRKRRERALTRLRDAFRRLYGLD